MKSAHEVSSSEVSSAIRYLDPDLYHDGENHKSMPRDPFLIRSMKVSGLVAALSTIFYLIQRYLPNVIRLLN